MKNPINYSFKTEVFPFLILLSTVILSFWAYPKLPDLVVSHWDFAGHANGWSSREFHVIFSPALLFAMYTLFSIMPKFDPHASRYQEFASAYRSIRNFILLIFFVIFAAATFSNLGYAVNIGVTVAGLVGLLMIILGCYFRKLKQNFFIGIRTPWTLSSENVWNKTHRLGSYLFIIWGACLMLSPWLTTRFAFIILFGGLVSVLACLMIYSYLLYKKEQEKK